MQAQYDHIKWEVRVSWDLPAGTRVDKNDWLAVYHDGEQDNTAHVKYDFASGTTSGAASIRIKRRVKTNDVCIVRYVNGANHKTYASSNRFAIAPTNSELAQQVAQEDVATGLSRGRIEDIQWEDEIGLNCVVLDIRNGVPSSQSLANMRRHRVSVVSAVAEELKDADPEAGVAPSPTPTPAAATAVSAPSTAAEAMPPSSPHQQARAPGAPQAAAGSAMPPAAAVIASASPQRAASPPGAVGSPLSASAAPPAAAGPQVPKEEQRWLWKRGHFVKNWKRRYFDVKDGALRYSSEVKGGKPKVKKSLSLDAINDIREVPDKDKRQFLFCFHVKKTAYYVSCSSVEERRLWVNYLRHMAKV